MKTTQSIRLAASLAIGLGLASSGAVAQSTDGYHTLQIFPMVVHTASFTQRFNFRNPNDTAISVTPKYHRGVDDENLGNPLFIYPVWTCPTFNIPAGKTISFSTLHEMCALPLDPNTGAPFNQYGFVYASEGSPANLPFAGFSRVSNPLGNGFTVEAFPAHTFTSADLVVNGLRRRAAAGGNPAFQTNCFVGNLNEVTAGAPVVSTLVSYQLYSNATNPIGNAVQLSVAPGQFIRVLDVFTAAGLPAGDYDDAQFKLLELGDAEPGLISFCTVQDNTSFGADFRIAKQELGAGGLTFPGDVIGSQDNHVSRETLVDADGLGRPFEIGTGAKLNAHVIYFRHPDYVQCEIIDPVSDERAVSGYGLEIRLFDLNGEIVAGGAVTGFGKIYLGDKTDRNNGSNTRYTIEVEDNNLNTGSTRPYKLHCQSGSGHTAGDLIRYKEAARF